MTRHPLFALTTLTLTTALALTGCEHYDRAPGDDPFERATHAMRSAGQDFVTAVDDADAEMRQNVDVDEIDREAVRAEGEMREGLRNVGREIDQADREMRQGARRADDAVDEADEELHEAGREAVDEVDEADAALRRATTD